MPDKPTQKLLPFDQPPATHAEGVRFQPSEDALEAFGQLKTWLCGPRGPVTEVAGETLRAVEKALIEGKNGWFHTAEDGLEAMKLRNGRTEGDDIPPGPIPEGRDFQQTVEDCLDAMHERMLTRGGR